MNRQLENLFLVTMDGRRYIMTDSTIQHHRRWHKEGRILTIDEAIGPAWPEGVTVECTSSDGRMCYSSNRYVVKSPRQLNDYDFEIMRAQHAFMVGQVCGAIARVEQKDDGTWEYGCYSECDSSD